MLGAKYKTKEMKVINIRGVDRLEFGLDIEDYAKEYKPILIELEEKKAEGQLEGKMQKIEYNNILLDVGMTGAKFYRYRTICKDFMMLFSGKAVKEISKEIPVIRTILYSGYLWSYGYQEAYYNYLKWLSYFPGSIEKTRLSRLDICLDTDEVEFNEEDKEKFITRAKSKTTHYVDESYSMGNKFSGFTIGRGKPMLVRIYNKTLEMQANNKEWLKHTWKENGWDGKKAVWRIEFQLRREALKELGIDQVEDYTAPMG